MSAELTFYYQRISLGWRARSGGAAVYESAVRITSTLLAAAYSDSDGQLAAKQKELALASKKKADSEQSSSGSSYSSCSDDSSSSESERSQGSGNSRASDAGSSASESASTASSHTTATSGARTSATAGNKLTIASPPRKPWYAAIVSFLRRRNPFTKLKRARHTIVHNAPGSIVASHLSEVEGVSRVSDNSDNSDNDDSSLTLSSQWDGAVPPDDTATDLSIPDIRENHRGQRQMRRFVPGLQSPAAGTRGSVLSNNTNLSRPHSVGIGPTALRSSRRLSKVPRSPDGRLSTVDEAVTQSFRHSQTSSSLLEASSYDDGGTSGTESSASSSSSSNGRRIRHGSSTIRGGTRAGRSVSSETSSMSDSSAESDSILSSDIHVPPAAFSKPAQTSASSKLSKEAIAKALSLLQLRSGLGNDGDNDSDSGTVIGIDEV